MADTLTAYKQNTKHYSLTFRDSAGTAINITGCTIYFTIKENAALAVLPDSSALLQKIIISHISPTGGTSEMTLTSSNLNIASGTYFFDFQMINASGEITTLQKGIFKIYDRVTLTTQ